MDPLRCLLAACFQSLICLERLRIFVGNLGYNRRNTGIEGGEYFKALQDNLRNLEDEQKRLLNHKITLQKQLDRAKGEVARLTKEPLLVGTLQEVFEHEQAVVRSSNGPSFLVNIGNDVDPDELVPGNRVILNQRTLTLIKVIPAIIDPYIRGMEIVERPLESYKDIGGLGKQLEEVIEIIELSLKSPELFEKVGIEAPKGALLHGPPGSGKTLIARAVAHEANATFFSLSGSELVQKYIGEGARLVRELFQLARKKAPAIIFIDEIDAIGSQRMDVATGGDREVQRTFMQLLAELDGFNQRGNVKIIAATNRIDILDEALLRPGRFDRRIEIPLPNDKGREEIVRIHTRSMSMTDVDVSSIARLTEGFNGAELKSMCTEAGMYAIRGNRDTVSQKDFESAIEKIQKKKGKGNSIPSGHYG